MLARQGSSPISSKMASLLHSSPAPVASSPLSKGNSSSASQFQSKHLKFQTDFSTIIP
jgi:hypothetical protein